MWLFKKKNVEADSVKGVDIFSGFTDWHCHILPGVDDGVQTMEEALAILAQYEQWGVRHVWLTPHIMEDIPNTTEHLRERFEELKKAYESVPNGGKEAPLGTKTPINCTQWTQNAAIGNTRIQLHLAAENMMDNLFEERLEKNDLLPIGPKGDHLLVETSYFNPPMHLYDMLLAVREAGYQPILAHPERYVYMEMRDYERLHGLGIKFQLNLFSQTGRYGKHVIKKMEKLLERHYYSYVGTDLHRIAMLGDADRLKLRSL